MCKQKKKNLSRKKIFEIINNMHNGKNNNSKKRKIPDLTVHIFCS